MHKFQGFLGGFRYDILNFAEDPYKTVFDSLNGVGD